MVNTVTRISNEVGLMLRLTKPSVIFLTVRLRQCSTLRSDP